MVAEHRRSGVVVWILIGLAAILGLTTAAAVSIPVFKCTHCRMMRKNPGEPPSRWVRINGRFVVSDLPCGACAGRMRLTGVTWLISAVQTERRR
jgi:hypothetical protein